MFLIEVELIYNVVLFSGVQKSDLVVYFQILFRFITRYLICSLCYIVEGYVIFLIEKYWNTQNKNHIAQEMHLKWKKVKA